jgi:hypothetical protein
MDEVKISSQQMIDFLDGHMPHVTPVLGTKNCKSCEYRDADAAKNGFSECWGSTPPRGLHIIDLFREGNGSGDLRGEVASRIASGDFLLSELPGHFLDGGSTYEAPRRHQLAAARSGKEVFSRYLKDALTNVTYPLYFMDFEASRIPVPYHAGMKPYELVAFQFSCHVMESPDSTELLHHEWLNLQDVYPNEEFLQQLHNTIGDTGTVFVWSHYEASLLRTVRAQLQERGVFTSQLDSWLTGLLGVKNAKGKPQGGRIVDLLKLSEAHYCHPLMMGSHSIKRVLDAVWSDSPHLWTHPWFASYFQTGSDRKPIDPYKTLEQPDDPLYLGDSEDGEDGKDTGAVTDGVGAMRAYQDMLFGTNKDNLALRDTMRDSLLRYCKLDTAAMVMIWEHWKHLVK